MTLRILILAAAAACFATAARADWRPGGPAWHPPAHGGWARPGWGGPGWGGPGWGARPYVRYGYGYGYRPYPPPVIIAPRPYGYLPPPPVFLPPPPVYFGY